MIKNNHLKLTIFAAAALIFSTIPFNLSKAATTGSNNKVTIGMSPVSKKLLLTAGKTTRESVIVTNAGEEPFTFKVSVDPYSVKNESYEADYITVKKNTDIESWVSFEKTSYTLRPDSKVEIPFTITVPANAAPGGHYGVIFAETQPEKATANQAAVQNKSRVGSVLYTTVDGDYMTGGKFTKINTPGLQFKAPLTSEIFVENTGNSDFAVDTVYAVSDLFGSRKFTQEKQYQMLPQSTRKIVLTWDKSPNFGMFKVTTSAKFLDQTTTKTSYVLMAPLLYYMIFVFAFLIAVIYFVAKRR